MRNEDFSQSDYSDFGSGQSVGLEIEAKSITEASAKKDGGRLSADASCEFSFDRLFARRGHYLTFAGVLFFTFVLYFRPYDLIPALADFRSLAYYIAIVTLLIFVPTQLYVEGRLSYWTTEVKCVLFIAVWALLTVRIASNPQVAWAEISQEYIRVVLIFVVLVNVLRSRRRLDALLWVLIAAALLLSYQTVNLYLEGTFKTEGYRISTGKGMLGNPNDMALFILIYLPLVVAYGLATRTFILKLACWACVTLMTVGILVTQSRGAFLGFVSVAFFLVWSFGKNNRLKAIMIMALVMIAIVILAPGNYASRLASIIDPSLDPNGSALQRNEQLWRSIFVTLRNPLGVGIGNSPIFGTRNLQTHNAYTQVSSELGWLAFVGYVVFLVTPFRRLSSTRKTIDSEQKTLDTKQRWTYFLCVGFQASILAYMVTSFFGSVAYDWFVYYPIVCSIALCRLYNNEVSASGGSLESTLRPVRMK